MRGQSPAPVAQSSSTSIGPLVHRPPEAPAAVRAPNRSVSSAADPPRGTFPADNASLGLFSYLHSRGLSRRESRSAPLGRGLRRLFWSRGSPPGRGHARQIYPRAAASPRNLGLPGRLSEKAPRNFESESAHAPHVGGEFPRFLRFGRARAIRNSPRRISASRESGEGNLFAAGETGRESRRARRIPGILSRIRAGGIERRYSCCIRAMLVIESDRSGVWSL